MPNEGPITLVMQSTAAGLPQNSGKGRQAVLSSAFEPWLYLSPALVLLMLVLVVPLIFGISYSFRKFSAFKSEYVGLAQYQALAARSRLGQALMNTLWWTVASLVLQFFLGLGLALLLDRDFAGKKIVQAIVFLPWAVPSFLSGLTWAWLFNPIVGPLPHWLYALGISPRQPTFSPDPATAMWGPIIANVWFGVPFFAITLLAALKSIPGELHEAAAIDGANPWQRFTKVTLPFLAPTIAITVMLADDLDRHLRRPDLCDDRRRSCRLHQHGRHLYLCQRLQDARQGLCLGRRRAVAGASHPIRDRADPHPPLTCEGV